MEDNNKHYNLFLPLLNHLLDKYCAPDSTYNDDDCAMRIILLDIKEGILDQGQLMVKLHLLFDRALDTITKSDLIDLTIQTYSLIEEEISRLQLEKSASAAMFNKKRSINNFVFEVKVKNEILCNMLILLQSISRFVNIADNLNSYKEVRTLIKLIDNSLANNDYINSYFDLKTNNGENNNE